MEANYQLSFVCHREPARSKQKYPLRTAVEICSGKPCLVSGLNKSPHLKHRRLLAGSGSGALEFPGCKLSLIVAEMGARTVLLLTRSASSRPLSMLGFSMVFSERSGLGSPGLRKELQRFVSHKQAKTFWSPSDISRRSQVGEALSGLSSVPSKTDFEKHSRT